MKKSGTTDGKQHMIGLYSHDIQKSDSNTRGFI